MDDQISIQEGLSVKQQQIVTIAAFTANGNLVALDTALNQGLNAGLTISEIKEVLVQLYAYCGFPGSLQGINTFMKVLEKRKDSWIKDHEGKDATPVTTTTDKYERGRKILEQLTGRPETGPKMGAAAFAPVIDTFLKEHLFADIFERDVLNYKDRELATISALISLKGVEPMLQAHLNMGMNVGLSPQQIDHLIAIIHERVGQTEAAIAKTIYQKVHDSRS
ncbi:Uncharacterized conserved protein YurZ, alkylhydroperoxidase/carboxymuconolactone decarboxylase family [Chitinophaga sp. YR627]|nr:Uncharacterized conserved protein YurZ, alkylhydroperoxidase/carboxymuconolactone decarboxylase family [Chitinophaga sp. YR627]